MSETTNKESEFAGHEQASTPENPTNDTTILVNRHTKKGKTETGITPEGEAIVKEQTKQHLLEILKNAAPGTIMAMVGSSDAIRTKSTSRVSGQELKSLLADKPDEYLVLDESDINNLAGDKAQESTIHKLQETIEQNPDKKVVINYPLYLKELTLIQGEAKRIENKPEWKYDKKGEKMSPYTTELLKRNSDNEFQSVKDWIRSGGKFTAEDGKILEGPNPETVAQEYRNSLKRLQTICKKLFPGRPLIIQETGHSWDIDVFVAYLTHNGEVSEAGFEEVAKGAEGTETIISEFESPIIKISDKGASITYRGKTYEFDPNLIK